MGSRTGKVIHTWNYNRNKKNIRVPVRMIVSGNTHSFSAEVPEYSVRVEADDLNNLKRIVFDELDKKTQIAWESFIYLEVKGFAHGFSTDLKQSNRKRADTRIEIVIEASPIQLGRVKQYESAAGKKVHRREGDTWTREDWPEVGAEQGYEHSSNHYSPDEMRSLIPDTPEHRAALDAISVEFSRIIKKLFELFAPRTVHQTLAGVQTRGLLSAAPKDETDNDQSSKPIKRAKRKLSYR